MSTPKSDSGHRLRTRWALLRNRILGNPAFQRWAARTPLLRSVARRRAAAQFDLVAGFVYSQILLAFVETGLLDQLAAAPRREDELMAATGLSADAADRLLRAATALDLAEMPQPGLWTLGEAGAALAPNSGALAMIRHHPLLYADLADPLALLRADRGKDTHLSAFWTYAARDAVGSAAPYSALMAATQPMVAEQIVGAYRFARHRRMLDIGGGTGRFCAAVARDAPQLELGIFDLPDVITQTSAAPPHTVRHGGNFRTDPLPTGYDLVTLIRILHDHDDAVAAQLLRSIWMALPVGGRLLIAEPMAGDAHAPRMGDAYFGLYLWTMGSGRPRSKAMLRDMLQSTGFVRVQKIPTTQPIIASAFVATK
jgi:demethylspheroidene O-methyltransferase